MNVCVIGLGYVGLTLAVYLARKGMNVHGIDVSENVLNSLTNGKAHFFETDFDAQLEESIKSGFITFGKDYKTTSENVSYIVTVGTP